MKTKYSLTSILVLCLLSAVSIANGQQVTLDERIALLVAEDELRFDETIKNAMRHPDASFRRSAALAAGRIGDETAVPYLTNLLNDDAVADMAMFGIGEIESVKAIETVSAWLKKADTSVALKSRTIEAAGKIVAANREAEASKALGLELLKEIKRFNDVAELDPLLSSLTLTALLRARPEGADDAASMFLKSENARVRADAGNTLARLRSKTATEYLRALLITDKDAVVRANAARALGVAKDPASKDLIYKAAVSDKDSRVRTNSISALVNFEDKGVGEKLLVRGEQLLVRNKKVGAFQNELISLANATGRIFRGSGNRKAVSFLIKFSAELKRSAPEVEIALVRVSPDAFLKRKQIDSKDWRSHSALAAALGESSELKKTVKQAKLREFAKNTLRSQLKAVWDGKVKTDMSFPAVLSNYGKLKTDDLNLHLRNALLQDDVVIRATAARLLGEQPIPKSNKLANYFALRDAFENAEKDELNDAHMATLDALSKQIAELQKDKTIIIDLFEPVKLAYSSPDYLIRRKAIDVAKDLGLKLKAKPERVSYRTKGNHRLRKPDYRKALTRVSASVIIETAKGKFRIRFYPKEAPLTVENFITLASKGYFNGLTIHRVVPNFVMQDGDPRGDGSGGPGWHIRCEINNLRYQRGTVGMALAGKDTGGSQWFVAHSPQPHLDGGYTVFGKVNEVDMKIVDKLSRGDKIIKVTVDEG